MGRHRDPRDMGEGSHARDTPGDGNKRGGPGELVRPEDVPKKDTSKRDNRDN